MKILTVAFILLLLKWSDNKSTLHKTTTRQKMFFISFFSRFIDRFALCVLFCHTMLAHQFMVTFTCTYTNVTVVIDVLVVVYNKTWENRVMLSLHGQLVVDIRPRCWLRVLKLMSRKSWRVFDSSTFSNLSQHLCWYPTLPDHDSMNNPSVLHYFSHCISEAVRPSWP